MRASGITRHGRRAAWLLVLPFLLPVTGCEDNGDTINVNGLDCGLIREDLFGDWTLTFTAESPKLVNCDDLTFNGRTVDVDGLPTVYTNPIAFVSPSGASFDVLGDGDDPQQSRELIASVEADSCLALVQKWESDDDGWIQCFGTLDLRANGIAAFCNSMDLDTDLDGEPEVACDLDRTVLLQVFTP